MGEDIIKITKTHVVCPHCGKPAGTVDPISPEWGTMTWFHEKCGWHYHVAKFPDGTFKVWKDDQPQWLLYWFFLKRDDVTLVLKSRRCASWEEDSDDYYYNEHTCPTNYLRVELVAVGDDYDPHGVFAYDGKLPVLNDEETPDEALGRFRQSLTCRQVSSQDTQSPQGDG